MKQHFGIVRDKTTGKPRVDDPATLHPIQIGMMTRAEREELGVHTGAWGVTADGPVPFDKTAGGDFVAGKNVRALGQIIEPGDAANETRFYKVTPRTDHKANRPIIVTLTEKKL